MARLVLILISGWLLSCQHERTFDITVNKANVNFKVKKGVCYVDGKAFSGTVLQLLPSGDTLSIENYWSGREHGTWKTFSEEGQMLSVRHFNNGKKIGQYQAWWPNGLKRLEYAFEDDEFDGLLKEWDVDGRLMRLATYRAGYEEGPQKMWYPNGKIRSNYVVIDGRRYGLLGTKNCINVSDSIFSSL